MITLMFVAMVGSAYLIDRDTKKAQSKATRGLKGYASVIVLTQNNVLYQGSSK